MSSKQPIKKIFYDGKEIILIGTAHISQESCDFVKEQIRLEKPDIVCVELCEQRLEILENDKKWENTDLVKIFKEKKMMFLLINILLSSFQEQAGEKVNIKPGAELMLAVNESVQLGIKFSLIDRSSKITLSRLWNKASFWSRIKLFVMLFMSIFSVNKISAKEIEEMKNSDNTQKLVDSMGKVVPNVKEVLISERDDFMSKRLAETKGKKILAIVGAGHLAGIEQRFKTNNFIDNFDELNSIPAKSFSFVGFVLKWFLPILIVCFIIMGFQESFDVGFSYILYWIGINGGLSALAVLLTGGHFVTILLAFVLAPITSLNPAIGVSHFTGLSELFFRRPTVRDLQEVKHFISHLSKWKKNRFTHVLLISLASGLASTIGSALASFFIIF